MPYFRFEIYEFDRVILLYRTLFGPNNVLVLPYEMLLSSPQRFVNAILDFCGKERKDVMLARSNERRPLVMQHVQRVANRYVSRTELNPHALFPVPKFAKRFRAFRPLFESITNAKIERSLMNAMTGTVATAVGDRYAASNRRTSDLLEIDLSGYGYRCGPIPQSTACPGANVTSPPLC